MPARRNARGCFAFPTNQSFVLSLPSALAVIITVTRSFFFFWPGTSPVEGPPSGTKRQKSARKDRFDRHYIDHGVHTSKMFLRWWPNKGNVSKGIKRDRHTHNLKLHIKKKSRPKFTILSPEFNAKAGFKPI